MAIVFLNYTAYRQNLTQDALKRVRDNIYIATLKARYVPTWFQQPALGQYQVDVAGRSFKRAIAKYAEVEVTDPWADIELYFRNLAIARGQVPPKPVLGYTGRVPMLNTGTMASAAEALAGWFCERHYGWAFLRRPQRVTPDLIFWDRATLRYSLVEVKSTGPTGNLKARVVNDMIKLLKHLAIAKLEGAGPYYAALIKVRIVSQTDIELLSLLLEEI